LCKRNVMNNTKSEDDERLLRFFISLSLSNNNTQTLSLSISKKSYDD
jgi:hypothetical protein